MTSAGRLFSRLNGPPGAILIMKNEIVMISSSVGMAPIRRRMA
jgi:hypothetical protein